jgi:benzaldehyde dehydrogenase (NAD)
MGPGERRALLMKAAHALEARGEDFARTMAAETGASGMWAGFNVHLAAGGLLEAAALTTQISGEVIPSDVPGSLAMGVRQAAGVVLGNGAVECAGDPRSTRNRVAAGMR